MYLYFTENGGLAGFVPSNRGRVAKNHDTMLLHGDTEISVSYVPTELVEKEDTTAETLKAAVSLSGSLHNTTGVEEVSGVEIYGALLQIFNDTLGGLEPRLAERFDDMLAQYNSSEFDRISPPTEWVAAAAELILRNKRAVNSIMNARGHGWFCRGYTAEAAGAAAEKVADESEPAADAGSTDTSYGFDRMSGGGPKLGVVSAESEKAKDEDHGVFYPKADATYIINTQIENLFKILEASSKKCPQNVNLIGPHGCGKTELAIQFAARLGRPLLIMDCANLREARDWFGYKSAKDGTVYWHESQFVRAVSAGNHVILLDELNRANPNLLNTLMPILDARRFTYLEEKGDKIVVGPGTVFFASMNEGAGYTGTSALDRAIRDRFPRAVELTYLGESDEIKLLISRTGVNKDVAKRLVQMANKIRQDATGLTATLTESLSTRQLLAAAHDFALGGVETLTFTITNHFSPDGDDESERVKVQNIIQGKFGDMLAAQAAAVSKGA
jgi:nitric oxide reductase NorQ protein